MYIPILPRCLLGVLSAPVPLILGLNSAFLPSEEQQQEEEEQQEGGGGEQQFSTPQKEQPLASRSVTTSSSSAVTPPVRTASSSTSSSGGEDLDDTSSQATCSSPRPLSTATTATASSTCGNMGTDEGFGQDERSSEFIDDRYYAGEVWVLRQCWCWCDVDMLPCTAMLQIYPVIPLCNIGCRTDGVPESLRGGRVKCQPDPCLTTDPPISSFSSPPSSSLFLLLSLLPGDYSGTPRREPYRFRQPRSSSSAARTPEKEVAG